MILRRRAHGDDGVVGICLCLVLAFALYAVVQLTRTTIAAQQIDEQVVSIKQSTPEIDERLTNVPKLDQTNETAAGILVAAKPLSAHLDGVITAAKSIDTTVDGINDSAGKINGSVHTINASVVSILASVRGIESSVAGVDATTVSIRAGVADINHRADIIIALAGTIRSDLDNVLAQVGPINGHAKSIDCSLLGSGCQG